jgi:RNA polymerase-binding transcription factor DksA
MDQSQITAFRSLLTEMNEELTPKVTKPDTIERDSKMLREVRTALTRIEYGSYGTCLNCDQNISASRLRAAPWASLCIPCHDRCSGQSRTQRESRGVCAA